MAIVLGTDASEVLNAADGVTNLADEIYGLGGNDEIYGLGNFDFIRGGAGGDFIDGGDGFDVSDYGDSGSAVFASLLSGSGLGGTANGDTLVNIEWLQGSAFNDFLIGDNFSNSLTGVDGNDLLQGKDGDDQLHGGAGDDTVEGGDGDDSFLDGSAGNDNIDGGAGIDRVVGDLGNDTLDGGSDNDSLEGRQGVDRIRGEAGIDFITGGDGDDTIDGGAENDRLEADEGNDSLVGGDGDDSLDGGPGADAIDGGNGVDTARYSSAGDPITVNLNGGTGSAGEAAGDILTGIENIVGSFGSDAITGDALVNRVEGNSGNDTIRGGGGNDVLDGNYGSDVLEGGNGADQIRGGQSSAEFPDTGLDLVSYAGSSAPVVVNLALNSFVGGDAAGDTVIEIEGVIGSAFDDQLRGAGAAETLNGNSGNDILSGSSGADELIGGAGVDMVSYAASAAAVSVNLEVPNTAGGDAQGDTLREIESVDGSAFADALLGNSTGNRLLGRDGVDFLAGREGSDQLAGGAGGDEIVGGAGLDTADYAGSNAAVRINLAEGTAAGGHAEGDALSSIEMLIGSAFGDALVGTATANNLNGGGGADTLTGGAGNDTYVTDGGDAIIEVVGAGIDRVQSSVNLTLGANLENLTLTGAGNLNGIGNGLANLLAGNAGNNVLDGGAGADTMTGGLGNDTYKIDNSLDMIVEGAGSGTDIVQASVSYLLPVSSAIELLTTANPAGTSAINLSGNEAVQRLIGNAGTNILDGRGGADLLQGLGGSDTYRVDNAADVVDETPAGSNGTDTVISGNVSINLGVNNFFKGAIENVTLGNNTAINAFGNGIANTLTGNVGVNTLDGSLGADTLKGLGGADTFRFTTALGAANIDTIGDYVVADDRIAIDNAVFTGLAAGALPTVAFFAGAAAHDLDDRIIYNAANGRLFFDADGNKAGGVAAIQFATLATGLAMSAGEFMVI